MLTPAHSLSVSISGNRIEVTIHSRILDESNIHPLTDRLSEVAASVGAGELYIDFEAVACLSSVVLAKLVSLHKRVAQAGGQLRLVNLSDDLVELFRITRLDQLLDIHPRCEGVTASA